MPSNTTNDRRLEAVMLEEKTTLLLFQLTASLETCSYNVKNCLNHWRFLRLAANKTNRSSAYERREISKGSPPGVKGVIRPQLTRLLRPRLKAYAANIKSK